VKTFSFLDVARMAMPLMDERARAEAGAIIVELGTSNAERSAAIDASRAGVALAFESDLYGVRTALAGALHAGGLVPLQGLRAMLPGLLREANSEGAFGKALARAMMDGVTEISPSLKTGNARVGSVVFNEDLVEHDALRQWRSREVFETDLGSAELRGFARQIRDRAVFSARTTNAEYLKEVAHVVDEILAGNMGMSEGRWELMKKLKQLGYDPVTGFPGDVGAVPPAERDSLQDLSSEQRIDLVLETNVRMAQGFAQVNAGLSDYALHAYPAWELVRLYHRETPRGTPESHSPGWEPRWNDAGSAVDWEGAIGPVEIGDPLIALKTSPIWDALGDGAGGYTDTLLNAFPPFAFRSGKAWKAKPREEMEKLGLLNGESRKAGSPTLTPSRKEVDRVFDGLPEDLRLEMLREIEAEEGGV
jgi:hypothetical protein